MCTYPANYMQAKLLRRTGGMVHFYCLFDNLHEEQSQKPYQCLIIYLNDFECVCLLHEQRTKIGRKFFFKGRLFLELGESDAPLFL